MSVDLEKLEQLRAKAIQEKQAPGYAMTAQAAYIAALVFAAPDLMAENRALREKVRELEIVEESLARNIADIAFCPLCLIKDCPQYHKGDLGTGAFEPESVDREQCKKSILAHARKGAKEFVNGQLTA